MSPENKPKSLRKQISHPNLGFRLVWNDAPKAPGGDAKVRCVDCIAQHTLCIPHNAGARHGALHGASHSAPHRASLDHTHRGSAPGTAQSLFAKYERVKTIGKGSFGTAVLLRHRRTGHMVVSKQVMVQEMTRDDLSKVRRRPSACAEASADAGALSRSPRVSLPRWRTKCASSHPSRTSTSSCTIAPSRRDCSETLARS